MTHNPKRIKRIGLAIEMEDGQQLMLYTESPTAAISFEEKVETNDIPRSGGIIRPEIVDISTEITITGIHGYALHENAPHTTARTIDRIHEITEGNPDDYR